MFTRYHRKVLHCSRFLRAFLSEISPISIPESWVHTNTQREKHRCTQGVKLINCSLWRSESDNGPLRSIVQSFVVYLTRLYRVLISSFSDWKTIYCTVPAATSHRHSQDQAHVTSDGKQRGYIYSSTALNLHFEVLDYFHFMLFLDFCFLYLRGNFCTLFDSITVLW